MANQTDTRTKASQFILIEVWPTTIVVDMVDHQKVHRLGVRSNWSDALPLVAAASTAPLPIFVTMAPAEAVQAPKPFTFTLGQFKFAAVDPDQHLMRTDYHVVVGTVHVGFLKLHRDRIEFVSDRFMGPHAPTQAQIDRFASIVLAEVRTRKAAAPAAK